MEVGYDADLLHVARTLILEYAALPHNVRGCWHSPAGDVALLPVPYAPPTGVLLVALEGPCGSPVSADAGLGCGALVELPEPGTAELKRLYVRPRARGQGIAQAIIERLFAWGDAHGLERILLDTAPELTSARALYARLGFKPIAAFRDGLPSDALCFERPVHQPWE